jgi:hypothetical protein
MPVIGAEVAVVWAAAKLAVAARRKRILFIAPRLARVVRVRCGRLGLSAIFERLLWTFT